LSGSAAGAIVRPAVGFLRWYEKTKSWCGEYWNAVRRSAGLAGRREARGRTIRRERDSQVGNDLLDRARRRGDAAVIDRRHATAGSCTACSGNDLHFAATQHAIRIQHLLAG